MTRRDLFHKWLFYALALVPVWLMDAQILPRLPLFGVTPMLLPLAAVAVAVPKIAMTVKLLRGSLLSELHSDYVRTAYSKGNTKKSVLYRHVLRNALIPVLTFLAMTIADIVAGSIIIEQVFAVPGMGRMLLQSISARDYPVVQAIIVIIAFVVVLANFAADLIYQVVDPRIELR